MPLVKLLNPNMTTHNRFKWEVGKTYTIDKPGTSLCTDQVFHGYHSPETAVLFNSRHANIKNPIAFSVEIDEICADDRMKFGCKSMTLVKKIDLPIFTDLKRVIFAILCAKKVRHLVSGEMGRWDHWADNFMTTNISDADAAYIQASDAYTYASNAADAVADSAYAPIACAYSDAAHAAAAAAAYDAHAAADAAAAAYAAHAAYAAYAAAYADAAYAAHATAAASGNTFEINFTELAKQALEM